MMNGDFTQLGTFGEKWERIIHSCEEIDKILGSTLAVTARRARRESTEHSLVCALALCGFGED